MGIVSDFCGEQNTNPFSLLVPCVYESLFDAIIPLFITFISLFFIVLSSRRKFLQGSDYDSLSQDDVYKINFEESVIRRSFKRCIFLQIILLFQAIGFATLAGFRTVDYLKNGGYLAAFEIVAPTVACLCWIIACILTYSIMKRRISPMSGIILLNMFTFSVFVASLIRLRATILNAESSDKHRNIANFVFTIIYTTFSLLAFINAFTIPVPWTPVNLHGRTEQDTKENPREPSPSSQASIFATLTFNWVNPLIQLGFKRPLEEQDLYELPPEYQPKGQFEYFSTIRKSSLLRRIVAANSGSLTMQIVFCLIVSLFDYGAPFFLQKLLNYIQHPTDKLELAFLYVICMTSCQVVRTLASGQMFYHGRSMDINLRGQLNGDVYAKSLRRKDLTGLVVDEKEVDDASQADIGKITNLMAVDTHRVGVISSFWYFLVVCPVTIVIGFAFLCTVIGFWSAIFGFAVMVLIIPLNSVVSRLYNHYQNRLMAARDSRISLMNELLQGIRMVKFFAWEPRFRDRILDVRKHELKQLMYSFICLGGQTMVWVGTPVLVPLFSFAFYTGVEKRELTAATAFTAIAIFERLRVPLSALPDVLMDVLNGLVSLRRIESFLTADEISPLSPQHLQQSGEIQKIGFEGASFQWHVGSTLKEATESANNSTFQLRELTLDFPIGELSIVFGPTGCGKTSLLMAMLGEMDIVSGKVFLPRGQVLLDPVTLLNRNGIAYVAQQPWLQQATIRENILFGQPLDMDRYRKVLRDCALVRDLEILEQGDQTEVGEKGITLSGGQKQRIALARAVYSRASHVLLDDCLSAVDSHTAKHIYLRCLTGELMRGRTRILVTHHVRLCLPSAKYLVSIRDGRVEAAGEVTKLRESGRLASMLAEEAATVPSDMAADYEDSESSDTAAESGEDEPLPIINGLDISLPGQNTNALSSSTADQNNSNPDAKPNGKLVQEEARERGGVKLEVYMTYLVAAGGILFALGHFGGILMARASLVMESWWLREWTKVYGSRQNQKQDIAGLLVNNTLVNTEDGSFFAPMVLPNLITALPLNSPQESFSVSSYDSNLSTSKNAMESASIYYYLSIYALICISTISFTVIRLAVQYTGSLRASRILHERLLNAILRAPIRFYDKTPIGRILNRFAKDLEAVDAQLVVNWSGVLINAIAVSAVVVVIDYIAPWFLVISIIIALIYYWVGRMYIANSRELKRLDSVSRSPIYSHFGETLVGVATIRAFGEQSRFMNELLCRVENNLRPYYYLWCSNRWLSVRADGIGALVSGLTGGFLLFRIARGEVDAGTAGLALSYALNFVSQVNFFMRWYTEMEMSLNAVERVQEFVDMPQEPPAIIEGSRPPAAWPTDGRIQVKDLVIKYAPELDPVIHGISFTINPGEKVGIVGRTGSGKSTMAISLFRFVEPESGSISIDGIDISSIGLHDLRSRLTIIPQEPILFSGTIRSNLDPFDEHDDAELWASLRRVHLIDNPAHVSEYSSEQNRAITSLDMPVSEGGGNFSQGQRSLLCLARALLRNSKILVMDEATASVDFDTDSRIQTTIREEFSDATLICIAHRLQTVIDYNRILVLDQGRIVEFDSPWNLLQNQNSVFYSLCERSGELDLLIAKARASTAMQLVNV
ncbi:uncharacterized protein VTP21DRAFT_372 [Calcarisporiella thermophila]|uniref:uncharacterized protein n=1 Tax=Calcarisporiella thermophila TaxID=911321 RepID=UPI0037427795